MEVLHILLKGSQPIIICPARSIVNMRTPQAWRSGIAASRILVISPFAESQQRITAKLSKSRNRFVAEMADDIFIAHATKGGSTKKLLNEYRHKL